MQQSSSIAKSSSGTAVFLDTRLTDDALNRLKQRAELHVRFASPVIENEAVVRSSEIIGDVQLLLCTYLPRNIEAMRDLRMVQLASSGYSQAQGLGLPARGVRVCNARGVNDTAIAEWNIAMMVGLARALPQMLKNQQSHVWDRSEVFQTEIRGATVGLWGYGGIGRQTARLCKSLGLNIHVLTRSGVGPVLNTYCIPDSGDAAGTLPDRTFGPADRHEFLKSLDFLILCLPLNAATEGIVGEAELRALRKSAFVLNPARGPLIKQAALLRALRDRWIAGAAIDTHYQYPLPADHPLWSFDNVILTPHISGSNGSTHFRARLGDLFSQNVDRFLTGQPLLNELSPGELDK